ncbi:MAG: LysR family transcriptional regulator [Polaromonas sp.]|jgi:DNA-binding transcriptional LysR family regulator|uniref:LysR family transcriptional regulator n=1 Tax=Polaromonas sp. TaxID=1869339 RepID=UPI002731ADB1|nr:LysR family transcriptional regulator [Polaromonas sp.]MDP2256371.1 LysR family transcriptional regulator [Polaromonas sp.]MDP3709337.1 LysR family transcriptional regulator [Polaromonas sp.]
MDRLLSMQVFEKVVAEGGFASAARALDLSPAVVSRLVSDLEEHLDTRLIQRTTRKLALTESGIVYLHMLRRILQEINDAEVVAQNSSGVLAGTLHLLTTPLLASYFLAPLAALWREQHPEVMLEVSVDPFSHLRVEEFDLTLMAVEEDYDADTVARVLGRTESILCAAPRYLNRAGMPEHPGDLHVHDYLKFPWKKAPGQGNGHGIRLTHVMTYTEPVDVEMRVVLQSLSFDVLFRAALAGAGLCLLSRHLAQPYFRDGALVHVLPQWRASSLVIYAALPTRKLVPARVVAMLDFLSTAAQQVFSTAPY